MTDEQIIEAVDVCKTGACRGCPYHVLGTAGCISILMKDVFGLINRQKAQIESLREENRILSHDADTAFQEGLNENRDLFKKEVEPEIRAEAYKEFAERLKKPISKCRLTAITEKETCSPGSELWEFWNAQEVEAELMLKSIDRVEKELTEEER